MDPLLLGVVLDLFISTLQTSLVLSHLGHAPSRATSPAPPFCKNLQLLEGGALCRKMSTDSVKKAGYLAKLPVKGLVKVSKRTDCAVAKKIETCVRRNGADGGSFSMAPLMKAWSE